jgi:ubiquinone/menaquinone biosynthesis C-methylase UbiE
MITSSAPHFGEDPQMAPPAPTIPLENEQEVARLLWQQQLLSDLIGGPLPPTLDLSQVRRVLDVGCGVGGWIYEMALRYPSMHVVGIDKNTYFIEQAHTLTKNLRNVTLITQDMYHLPEELLAPNSFDIVHMRFLEGEVPFQEYPQLIQTLITLCQQGGLFVVCEGELPLTSSTTCDHLETMLLHALQVTGRAFAQGFSLRLGIIAWLRYWLHQAGLYNVQDHPYHMEISYGTKAHTAFCQQAWHLGQQLRPFLLRSGVITASVFEQVITQMQQEIQMHTFCGVWPLHVLVGHKRRPEASQPSKGRSKGSRAR